MGGAQEFGLQSVEGADKVKGGVAGYQFTPDIRIHGFGVFSVHSGIGIEELGFVGVQRVLDDE